jgi:hypothetical protein
MTLAPTRTTLQLRPSSVSSSRSVTRTLRLDEDVEAGIVEMAEKEQFSFNLLANRALRRLVEWEDNAAKFGFIQVPTSIVEKVFNILTDDEARELGRDAGTNTLPEMILFWFQKFTPENALRAMEMIGSYGHAFKLQYTMDEGTDTVVLKHDRGRRVSSFYSELLKALFKPLGARTDTQETDGQVVATITRPPSSLTNVHREAPMIPDFAMKNGRAHKE